MLNGASHTQGKNAAAKRGPAAGGAPEQHARSWEQSSVNLGQLIVTVSRERGGDVESISLFGELDLATAGGVRRELERVEATDARSIVVDLSGLTFVGSAGVQALLDAHKRGRAGRLTLRRGSPEIQRIFELTGVVDSLPFTD